jgi:hypothetical protein
MGTTWTPSRGAEAHGELRVGDTGHVVAEAPKLVPDR